MNQGTKLYIMTINTLTELNYIGITQQLRQFLHSNPFKLGYSQTVRHTFAVVIRVLLLLIIRAKNLLRFLRLLRRGFLLGWLSSSGIGWLPDGQTHQHSYTTIRKSLTSSFASEHRRPWELTFLPIICHLIIKILSYLTNISGYRTIILILQSLLTVNFHYCPPYEFNHTQTLSIQLTGPKTKQQSKR